MEEGNRKRTHPNKRLRAAREQRGWSQKALADRLETTELTIGRWERGERTPQLLYRARLCEIFGMTAEELGLVEAAEEPTEVETPQPHASLSISSASSPSEETCPSPEPEQAESREEDEPVLVPSMVEPLPKSQRHPSPHRLRSRRSLQLLGAGFFSIAVVVILIMYPLHPLFFTTLPAPSIRSHVATPTATPAPLWHGWPQTLNDALLETDHDANWEVDQNSAAGPGPIFGICNFSPLSHTYQLQSFGANYCPYASGQEYPWTDLAYSVELSIRQGTWGGIVIRLHQRNFYYFNISTKGTYELLVHQNINGGIDTDVATGSSPAIHQGLDQWNTLLIAAQGSLFQLWINGQYVTTARNSAVRVGTIGVQASYGLGHGAPVTMVWYRHAQVWRPAGSS